MSTKLAEKAPPSNSLLVEKAGSEGSVWEIRVIEAGQGSSGWYPAEVLERDGAKAFPAGTRTLANHDSMEDTWNGGDIMRIMGGTREAATYRDGALWAEWEPNSKWRDWVAENYKYVGVSINTPGQKEVGTIGDYTGDVVTALENGPYTSIDVVIAPGAGGRFTRMLESAKEIITGHLTERTTPAVDTENDERKSHMEIEELAEKVDKLTEGFDAMHKFIEAATPLLETLKPAETPEVDPTAAVMVAYEKALEAGLPKKLRESVIAAVKANPEVDVDAAVKEQNELVESLKDEIADGEGYVRESAPVVKDAKTLVPRSWSK